MQKQPDITPNMRCILVDWLVEVSEEYKLNTETLYLAVNYIDRFLSMMSVQRAKLQLVGTAAMFIASKYEEIYPPDVSEFVYITDDTYTKKQVLRMEHLVLKILEFDVSVPTSHLFTHRIAQMADCDARTTSLASYINELSLMSADFLQFAPSQVAAACVALARHTLGLEVWPAAASQASGWGWQDLDSCVLRLHATHASAEGLVQQATRSGFFFVMTITLCIFISISIIMTDVISSQGEV
jgi:cyclin A